MPAIYSVIDWKNEESAFASVNNLLRHTLGRVEPSADAQFQLRFSQAQNFEIPQTGFSPLMLYALYGIAAAQRPQILIGCGTYAGTAFSLLAAGAIDFGTEVLAIGADEDAVSIKMAEDNAEVMQLHGTVTYECRPAEELPGEVDQPVDLLFLDVDHPVRGKKDYVRLASLAHSRLTAGAVLLAHDACVERCRHDIENLTAYVTSTGQYRGPWVLPIDKAGLWMAVRQ